MTRLRAPVAELEQSLPADGLEIRTDHLHVIFTNAANTIPIIRRDACLVLTRRNGDPVGRSDASVSRVRADRSANCRCQVALTPLVLQHAVDAIGFTVYVARC